MNYYLILGMGLNTNIEVNLIVDFISKKGTLQMDIQTVKKELNSTDTATASQEDTICVEGCTKELCENPDLFPVVESLKDLKNKFIHDVRDMADKYNLDGTVRVIFSILTREKNMEEISI